MFYVIIFLVFYIGTSLTLYVHFHSLSLILSGIRSALPNKARSKVDDEVILFKDYKARSILWPMVLWDMFYKK